MVERSQILFEVDDEMLMRNGVSSSAIRNNRFISFTSTVVDFGLLERSFDETRNLLARVV